MDLYTITRLFADSWALLAMALFFAAAVLWAFRPGSAQVHRDISRIPFRHEDKPARDGGPITAPQETLK